MNNETTIKEVKKYLHDNFETGAKCPCCGQFVRLYSRRLYISAMLRLIELYKLGGGYHHMNEINKKITETAGGDFAKLRFWGLIIEKPKDNEEKRTSGYWAITEKGKQFVRGEISLQERIKLYNQKCYGFEGDFIMIGDVLGTKFNYQELMYGEN